MNKDISLESLNYSGAEVVIIEADRTLQKIIGVPLSTIFTKERLRAAEKLVESKAGEFIARCTDDAVKMKRVFIKVQEERDQSAASFQDMKSLALCIKSFSGLAGFPLATEIARSLCSMLDRVKALDKRTLAVIGFHVDSIFAIFSEGRRDIQDAIAQQVLNELKNVSRGI